MQLRQRKMIEKPYWLRRKGNNKVWLMGDGRVMVYTDGTGYTTYSRADFRLICRQGIKMLDDFTQAR